MLIPIGAVLVALIEWTNTRTIRHMGPANRILEALFTSINFRTSGFTRSRSPHAQRDAG